MSGAIEPKGASPDQRSVFFVAPDGETTGEIDQLKQTKLEFMQLSADEPFGEIDVRKITGEEVQILLLDFGMPLRVVTVSGDFRTDDETERQAYTDTDDSSPNHLEIRCSAYGYDSGSTHYYLDGIQQDYSVPIRRGEFMNLDHAGKDRDVRNGFIDNGAEIVLTEDWVKTADMSDARANLMTIGYDGHSLKLRMHQSANAYVIYGKSIGFADRHNHAPAENAELLQLLGRLSHEEPSKVMRELFGKYAVMVSERDGATTSMETMEALLARNRALLARERSKVWTLRREINALKSKSGDSSDGGSQWSENTFGTGSQSGRAVDLASACKVLGLDPSVLNLDPNLIVNLTGMSRKAWAKSLHSDLAGEKGGPSEEQLKAINNAADAIVHRYQQKPSV